MNLEIEKVTNSIKGVAGMLSAMIEAADGSMIWNEWALYLLYKNLNECVEKLEELNK